ncbi:hypothetical protein PVPAM_030029700 [Plasmodium vivax]|nr:hypothetical protein PVPAM_030029700 [Plasmodium vivax]
MNYINDLFFNRNIDDYDEYSKALYENGILLCSLSVEGCCSTLCIFSFISFCFFRFFLVKIVRKGVYCKKKKLVT